MKVIAITAPGGPEALQVAEREIPRSGSREVLIKVSAAGINRPDVLQRKGSYPAPPGAPQDIPGLEVAGIVASAGRQVRRWRTGDRVCALVSGGGYAEYCVAPEGQCLPVPGDLSFAEAASLPETFFTVWSNVFDRGGLGRGRGPRKGGELGKEDEGRKGGRLLVHGGSGGIGTAAIQIAAACGCTVFTTAGTDEKCRFCEGMGAVRAINYRTEDFEKVIRSHPLGKEGMDVVLDMIGGEYTPANLRLLADEGRLVLINVMKGREAAVDLLEIMRRRLVITGSTLRSRDTAFKSRIARKLEKYIWPLLESGTIRPVVSAVFPLEDAGKAHALMESGEHHGKIVLETKVGS